MNQFTAPAYEHGTLPKKAIVLVNLGTPDDPTPKAVRRYLKQFLWDKRVVEVPRFIWFFILHGIILPFRGKSSAKKYQSIWLNNEMTKNRVSSGSPLRLHTERQTALLQQKYQNDYQVVYAMRYGTPSIHEVLDHLHEKHTTEIKIIPLFPQYSATTTASIQDEICRWQMKQRRLPSIKFLNTYHDDENYINALAKSIEKAMPQQLESHQHLLFSFHGIPQRNLNLGDHYHCLCQKTARLVAEKLGLQKETQYSVSFQSRLGKATWLKPYTTDVLNTLPQQGKTELFVVCPAFTSDCLETLEEIDMEGREDFLHSGGQKYHYIPALNEDDLWIETLYQLSKKL